MEKSEENDPIVEVNLDTPRCGGVNFVHENDELNDTRFLWNIFNHKPSRISLYSILDGVTFWELVPKESEDDMIINAEIVIEGDKMVNSYKYLLKLEDSIYISFYEVRDGVTHDINSITFYYNSNIVSVKDVNEYLESFQQAIVTEDVVIDKYRYLIYDQGLIDTVAMEIPKTISNKKVDFFELYPRDQRDDMRKLLRDVESSDNTMNCIYGEQGTNKQMFINHIIETSSKHVVLIPYNIAETFISSMEITESIKRNPNTLFVITDADGIFINELLLNGIYQVMNGTFGASFDVMFTFNDKNSINNKLLDSSDNLIGFGILSDKEMIKLNKYLTEEEKGLLEEISVKKTPSYF